LATAYSAGVRSEAQTRRRGDVHDRSAAALGHRLDGEVDAEHDAAEIEIQIPRPLLDRRIRKERLPVTPGVVNEDVEAAETALRLGDHLLYVVLSGDVGLDEGDASRRALQVCDDDVRALFDKALHDRTPDSAAATRDNGALPADLHVSAQASSARGPL